MSKKNGRRGNTEKGRCESGVELFTPRRSVSVSRLCVFVFCASLCLGGLFSANAQSDGSQQNKTGRAGTFAITNARIVTVSGAVIENGTVVIQDGKIAAVGASVGVPANAERIDGTGLSLMTHPAIEETNVIGVPDDYRGEAPVAFIKLKAGQTVTEAEIKTFLSRHISKTEMPREVIFKDALPKTLIGKLSKKELRTEYAARKAAEK